MMRELVDPWRERGRGPDRRAVILQAAFEIMTNAGPHADLVSIAFQAGISTGLLTHYFRRKRDLQLALFLLLCDEGAFARARDRRRDLLPPPAHLRRIINDTFLDERPLRWELFVELARPTTSNEVRVPIALRRERDVKEMRRLIPALLSEHPDDAPRIDHGAAAESIVCALESIGLRSVCTVGARPTRTERLIEARRAVERELAVERARAIPVTAG